jgi:Derlin-2/3
MMMLGLSLERTRTQALHIPHGQPSRPGGVVQKMDHVPVGADAGIGLALRLRGGAPKTPTKAKKMTISTKKSPVEEWWFSHPFVTRYWFAACVITTLVSWDKLPVSMPPTGLILYWPAILRLQLWRLFTTFTYFGSVGHNMLMECVFMLNYSKSMESLYNGKRAQYLWHLILNGLGLMVLNFLVGLLGIGMDQEDGSKIPGIPFLAQPLLYSIVWMWARKNPDQQMSVFGFFNVKAVYYPWFLLIYHLVMGNGLNIFYIMGFVVGHLFHFLTTLHPVTKNSALWEAPAQLERLMPSSADGPGFTTSGGDEKDEGKDSQKPKVSPFTGKGARLGKK